MTLSFPCNPNPGDTYEGWMWDGSKWVATQSPLIIASDTAPANPTPNMLWFSTTDGRLLYWFETEAVWVEVGPGQPGPPFLSAIGVTDGSNAAAGYIGEYIEAQATQLVNTQAETVVVSTALQPGDWHVEGFLSTSGTNVQQMYGRLVNGLAFNWALNAATFITPSFPVPPMRYNLTAPQAITLSVVMSPQASWSVSGVIKARRVR